VSRYTFLARFLPLLVVLATAASLLGDPWGPK
jgi:hypothetical protein